jgi:hypothetical protein
MNSYRGKSVYQLKNGMIEYYSDTEERFLKFDNLDNLTNHIDTVELEDVFNVHGVYTMSNLGGYEVEISSCGDSARMRDAYGGSQIEVSEWKEIEYVLSEDEEEESIPVIDPQGYNIELNQVIRNL